MKTSSARVFHGPLYELCIPLVTQYQTMETLSVMTSVSPNNQTKGWTPDPKIHTWTKPLTHGCVYTCVRPGYKRQEGHGGLCRHPWVEKHISYECAWQIPRSVVKRHSLLRNNLITGCLAVLSSLMSFLMYHSSVTSVGVSAVIVLRLFSLLSDRWVIQTKLSQ